MAIQRIEVGNYEGYGCDWLPVYVPSQWRSNFYDDRLIRPSVVIGFPFMYLRSGDPTTGVRLTADQWL